MRNVCYVHGDDRCLRLSRFLKTFYGLKPPCSGEAIKGIFCILALLLLTLRA